MSSSSVQPGNPRRSAIDTSVEMTLPAEAGGLSLLRGVAAALAVSLDFDIDTMADLRMAVDELAATVIARARPGTPLRVELVANPSLVTVRARALAADDAPLDHGSFGWMVLTTLSDEVDGAVAVGADGDVEIDISLRMCPPQRTS